MKMLLSLTAAALLASSCAGAPDFSISTPHGSASRKGGSVSILIPAPSAK